MTSWFYSHFLPLSGGDNDLPLTKGSEGVELRPVLSQLYFQWPAFPSLKYVAFLNARREV